MVLPGNWSVDMNEIDITLTEVTKIQSVVIVTNNIILDYVSSCTSDIGNKY